MTPVVLDTNVVLDAFVFRDPRTLALREALLARSVEWIATASMRDELAHVLAYPHIAARCGDDVLGRFDAHVRLLGLPPPAPVRCTDADDQKFIDLAWHHRAVLVSKDRAVLKLRRRMEKLGCPSVTPAYAIPNRISEAPGQ